MIVFKNKEFSVKYYLTKLSIEALNGIVSETEGSKFAATKTFGRID